MYSKYSRKERTQAYLYGKGKMHTSTIKPAFPVSRLSLESLSLSFSPCCFHGMTSSKPGVDVSYK